MEMIEKKKRTFWTKKRKQIIGELLGLLILISPLWISWILK